MLMCTFSDEELARYQRQMTIPEWGEKGQGKLKEAKVVVAGAGGLGSAVLTYLAAAGIGNIRIIDNDVVDRSNLNRQILHSEKDIGKKKIDSAREKLATLNSDIRIETIGEEINENNVFDLVADYPIVDALDNLPTRYLLNSAAIKNKLPLFHGAIYGLEGRATTIIPGTTPCLHCLYQGSLPGEIPVAGVTPGIIGCIQATEVIKYVLDIGELLTNRLLVYDGLSLKFSEMKLKKNPNCAICK
ncbi:MAG: HesA/MoeB/ThiF family protein [Chloroflexi bacterium]|nr:HesA/MoeB/ThiF family protein [Chloroflexota bacterium]